MKKMEVSEIGKQYEFRFDDIKTNLAHNYECFALVIFLDSSK